MDKFSGEISIPGLDAWIQSTVVLDSDKTSADIDFDENPTGLSQIDS